MILSLSSHCARRVRSSGGPRVIGDPVKLRQLLANGASHRAAARVLGVSEGTVRRTAQLDTARSRLSSCLPPYRFTPHHGG
jgi:hypothetical protein